MATEEYQVGYEAGYQDGFNAAQQPPAMPMQCKCFDEVAKKYCADKGKCSQAVAQVAQQPQAEAVPSDALRTFLDAAAGEGLVLDGVDAADLYIKMFPERYAAAIAQQKGGV